MEHLKRSTRYRSYVHIAGTAPQEGEQPRPGVRIELAYTKGSGYDVAVRPIQLLPGGLFQTMLVDSRAVRILVDPAPRFSERRLTQLALQLDGHVPDIARLRVETIQNGPVQSAVMGIFTDAPVPT